LTSPERSIFGASEDDLPSLGTVSGGFSLRPSRILTLPKRKVSGR